MTRIFLRLPSLGIDWNGPTTFLKNPRLLLIFTVVLLLIMAVVVLWASYGPQRWPQKAQETQTYHGPDPWTHNYGIVIDAGSSGSKVQLFFWPLHDGDPANLLQISPLTDEHGVPLTMKVEPGISIFNNPDRAYTSLKPLLTFALSHIPPSKHQGTSLYVLGTAGMRMMPEDKQQEMIGHLHRMILFEFPFYLPQDGVQVISGKMEGVFSWITINYLLKRFKPEYHHHEVSSANGNNSSTTNHTVNTVGSLDMGGGSLQVAFEIPPNIPVPATDTIDINLGCGIQDNQHRHRVYITTYLGYGTNEARRRYYKLLTQRYSTLGKSGYSRDPCLPLGLQENITAGTNSLKLRGLGDFRACRRALLPLLWQNSSGCVDKTCHLESFKKPPVKYDSLEFYGTSEFWYTMRDVLRIGGPYLAASFERAAKDFCLTPWNVLEDRYKKNLYPYADFYRLKSQCLKSAWMSLILHEGLGLPESYANLHTAATIMGQSVQWSLGSLLYHTRFLPLREIQMQQMKSSPLPSGEDIYTTSSFTLPFLVVLCVAVLLLLCRRRRPTYYSFSRTSSRVPISRTASSLALLTGFSRSQGLSRSQSTSRLGSIISTATSGF